MYYRRLFAAVLVALSLTAASVPAHAGDGYGPSSSPSPSTSTLPTCLVACPAPSAPATASSTRSVLPSGHTVIVPAASPSAPTLPVTASGAELGLLGFGLALICVGVLGIAVARRRQAVGRGRRRL